MEKVYATTNEFQLTLNVKTNGNEILINGLRGPLKEPFESKIIPDNQTYTDVDLGRIGGIRKTLAEFKVQILFVLFVLFDWTPSKRKEMGIPLGILPHVR